MSRTGDVHVGRLTYRNLNHRAVAEIQRNIVERRGKRNAIGRLLHARDDKEAIAAWGLGLNRILHVFNVGSVTLCTAIPDCPLPD